MKRLVIFLALLLFLAGCVPAEESGETYGPGEEGFVTACDYVSRDRPPNLHIQTGEASAQALSGGCSWNWKASKDYWSGFCSDSMHPLDCKELLTPIITHDTTAMLIFADMPESITVHRWSDSQWGNCEAEAETVAVNGQTIPLENGGWVYEVTGKWDDNGYYYGTASYCFYILVNQ